MVPLYRLYSRERGDKASRTLHMHFDKSACHTEGMVVDQMSRLRCRRVPHFPYSQDIAIYDFELFEDRKKRLMGVRIVDANDRVNEVTSILTRISEDEKNLVLDHRFTSLGTRLCGQKLVWNVSGFQYRFESPTLRAVRTRQCKGFFHQGLLIATPSTQ
jgi:hypothetical protein